MPRGAPGRTPVGERGRQTVEAIRIAGAEILLDRGRITMNAVAERAGISIGSLYQYFPHESALLSALAEKHLEAGRELLRAALETRGDLRVNLEGALIAYLRLAEDPLVAAVMRAIRADVALDALDRADTDRNAKQTAAALGDKSLAAPLALIIDLGGVVALRAAEQSPRAAAQTRDTYLRMARAVLGLPYSTSPLNDPRARSRA